MEPLPNNLQLPFLIIFNLSHIVKKSKLFVIHFTFPFLEVCFLRKGHSEVILSHSVLVLNKIDQIINKINSGNKGA